MDRQGPREAHALDVVLYNAESVQPRLDGIAEAILVPGLCNVETRRQDGQTVKWLMSKGYGFVDGHEISLVERLPNTRGRKRGDELEYMLGTPTLVIDGNMRSILAYLQGGILVNNDAGITGFDNQDAVYQATEELLKEILDRSKRIAADERAAHASQRSKRNWRIGRAVSALAIVGGVLWQGPNIIAAGDKWHQDYVEQQAKNHERSAAQKRAAIQADIARIAGFDRDHPDLRVKVQLKDGRVKIPVPFTEEFDGIAVPGPEGTMAPEHIRTYPLPKSGECETISIVIPEGRTLEAARTGDPYEIIFATQDSLANEIKVCDANLDSGNTVKGGELFLKLAALR